MQHRRRIGEAGGFQHHAAEFAAADCRDRAAASRAPRPDRRACVQHRQPLCSSTMLSPTYSTSRWSSADLAELVDDDGGVGQRRVLQQSVEQRGLAGAEKAGQHRERNRVQPAGAGQRCSIRPARSLRDRRDFRLCWSSACAGLAGLSVLPAWRRTLSAVSGAASPRVVFAAAFFCRVFAGGDLATCGASGLSAGPVNTVIGAVGLDRRARARICRGRLQVREHVG